MDISITHEQALAAIDRHHASFTAAMAGVVATAPAAAPATAMSASARVPEPAPAGTVEYHGHLLRYLTPPERARRELEESDVAAEVDNGRIALLDSESRRWFYLDRDRGEVVPDVPFDYNGQTHYNTAGESRIVPREHIVVPPGVGNEQEWKKRRLKTAIRSGATIPPISVTVRHTREGNRYVLSDGLNRYLVSGYPEFGFADIPVAVFDG